MNGLRLVLIGSLGLLTACSWLDRDQEQEPTIASLEKPDFDIRPGAAIETSLEQTVQNYRDFLVNSGSHPLRAEAVRRLADLEMETSEAHQIQLDDQEGLVGPPPEPPQESFNRAIALYKELLENHPEFAASDSVIYQLAKAGDIQGDPDEVLAMFDRLIKGHKQSKYLDEVQFRRGEILFSRKDYRGAEQAYQAAIQFGRESLYFQRALFKHGWSLFKQGLYQDGLYSFLKLMDEKLFDPETQQILAENPNLSRGDAEVLEDTMRVISLSVSYLEGHKTITKTFKDIGPRPYEYQVYQFLGDLYMKQERIDDAATTYNAFVKSNPNHAQAPLFQVRVINAYQKGGFSDLTLAAMVELVERYGVNTPFWQQHDQQVRDQVKPHIKTHLIDLAKHHHALAQKSKKPNDYAQAARWYREYVQSFPKDPGTEKMNFLLAESLFESKDFINAAREYENTAYNYPVHKQGAEAGYAALIAYNEQIKRMKGSSAQQAIKLQSIYSSLRFADNYPSDKRVAPVLTRASEELFKAKDYKGSMPVAQRIIDLQPPATTQQRTVAWTVLAHSQFELARFGPAEASYQQVLRLTPAKDPKRKAMVERMAAAIYKQGEQNKASGNLMGAVNDFLRLSELAPKSPIRVTAQYDAAATLLELKEWTRAVAVLENFRQTFPKHPLSANVGEKLAVAYKESGQLTKAAGEFTALAMKQTNPTIKREAMWEAADLYEKAGDTSAAISAYKNYVKAYPRPVSDAMEARNKLTNFYKKQGQTSKADYWLREIIKADAKAGSERSARSRSLAANASLELAQPKYQKYKSIKLVIPLKRSLKKKKKAMQSALKSYEQAAAYEIAEVTTASTFQIAEIYQDLSVALMASQRPKNLNAEELEQYDILLEEQAFPFEEKSIEFHQVNAERVSNGIYDSWVKKSFQRLSKLNPIRYGKTEQAETAVDEIR